MSASKLVGNVVLIVVCCVMIYVAFIGEPKLPIGVANGSYSNPCCGTLVLRDGQLIANNQHVTYVVESDKEGPYVLPKTYVGASGNGFVLRPKGYALKLRIDDPANPLQMDLIDDHPDGALYAFKRLNGS